MNEMIYGNTGKRDEGINIDMEQALYQKLQSRTFVPKLKSMLNDRLQEGDKNFVFIGEVADKAGNFSVYGYNAKLESDSRGGDYGHYMAMPVNPKAVSFDINNVKFLTEEGFVEYVNLKTLNEDKRFVISASQIDIDTDAKKKIVNNLMETFMKVRKRKNVTFSFDYTTVEDFTSKSIYVLMDLMKYIPYQMRKNISFISHVASNQKLPDMINLAAYPATSEFKPHDCISLSGGVGVADGIFSAYVEKVFAMSDAERETYFEKIYTDIETPAISAGVDVRADLYLLDVSTKELWTVGDTKEAIANIFNSVDDILKIYPEYNALAKKKIEASPTVFVEFILGEIKASANVEELKTAYKRVYALYEVCGYPMEESTIGYYKARANEFIEAVSSSDSLIKVLDGIVSINVEALDREVARNAIRKQMSKKSEVNDIHELYLKLKEKKFIDPHELNICLNESVEENILNAVEKYSDSKDKLSALERMYETFKSSTTSRDYPHVKEVFDSYKVKFSSGANAEAKSKGNEILYKIEKEIRNYSNFYDTKNYVKELANIEVNADEGLKMKTSDIYRRVSAKLFDELAREELSYEEFVRLLDEITPSVKTLDKNEVYDNPQRSGWGTEKYVPDGMFKFVEVFNSLIDGLRQTDDLTEALLTFENSKDRIKPEERQIRGMFDRFGGVILAHWFKKHNKLATEHNFKKAEKELHKHHRKELSHSTERIIRKYLERQSSKGKRGGKLNVVKLIIAIVLALAILAGLGYGGFKLYKLIFGPDEPSVGETVETPQDVAKYYLSENDKYVVDSYLNSFKDDSLSDAAFIIASIEETSDEGSTEKAYSLTIKDVLKSNITDKVIKNVNYAKYPASKEFIDISEIDPQKQYIVVIHPSKDNKTAFIRDIYPTPEDLEKHDFDMNSLEYRNEFISKAESLTDADLETYANILKYIGNLMDEKLVGIGEPPKTETTGNEGIGNEQKPEEEQGEGSEESDKEPTEENKPESGGEQDKDNTSKGNEDTSGTGNKTKEQ